MGLNHWGFGKEGWSGVGRNPSQHYGRGELRFQGSYGVQEGMGGLVASHIGTVQTLRGGALMHLGHVTADIFE